MSADGPVAVLLRRARERSLLARAVRLSISLDSGLYVLLPRPIIMKGAVLAAGLDPEDAEHDALMANRRAVRTLMDDISPATRYTVIDLPRPVFLSTSRVARRQGCATVVRGRRLRRLLGRRG